MMCISKRRSIEKIEENVILEMNQVIKRIKSILLKTSRYYKVRFYSSLLKFYLVYGAVDSRIDDVSII